MEMVQTCIDSIKLPIPKVKEGVEISVFDDGNEQPAYLITFHNRQWKVSEIVYYILCSIDGKRTSAEIRECVNRKFVVQMEEQKLEQIIEMAFVRNGILEGTASVTAPPKNKMMWGRFTLLRPGFIGKFKAFSFLFHKYALLALGAASVVWLAYIFSAYSNTAVVQSMFTLDIRELLLCYIFVFLAGLVHELGHSISAMSYGVRPGRIGVGVYFIMPVLFSDVTRVWKIKRHQRVIVDLGGMYLQCVFLLLSFLINLLFMESQLLNLAILLSGFTVLGNFNPFIRFDGYWMLVDFLGMTEVKSVVSQLWLDLWHRLLRKPRKPIPLSKAKRAVIYVYSLATAGFYIYFIRFLGESFLLALRNIASDIAGLYRLAPGEWQFTFSGFTAYLSERITTFIVLFFLARLVWRYGIRMPLNRLLRTGTSMHKEARYAAD